MAATDDFMTLPRVGPGTPMGNLLRRYWLPLLVSEQLREPGGQPVRARLLGEDLVGYRDPDGNLGLVGEHCPHRGVSLVYSRNEKGGLRCIYHGWKINAAGAVVEAPAEPPGSALIARICHTSYSIHEAGGIVWAYMGPPKLKPAFPTFPWLNLNSAHLLVAKMFQDCNYLQGLEGDYDPAHPNYLHKDFQTADNESWLGAGWKSALYLRYDERPQIFCEETEYAMRFAAVRKTPDPKLNYVRVFESCAPVYSYPAAGPHESRVFKAWQPVDDTTSFTFYVHFDFDRPLNKDAIYQNWGHRTVPPFHRVPNTLQNMHLRTAERQAVNMSGIEGAAVQDLAVQESMGPIYDRGQEHLATSDKAVIFYRRHMLRLIERNEAGESLPGLDASLDFQQRGVSVHLPVDRPWQDAHEVQEEYERSHPITSTA